MKPKLLSVDTKPEHDPWQQQADAATWSKLSLDPRSGEYRITQEGSDRTTPMDEWHGLVLAEKLDGHPDTNSAREYLESDEAVGLIKTIIAGYEVEWDGNNHVGRLDDDAREAWDELVADINRLLDTDWELWDVSDWIDPIDVTAPTTLDELKQLAADAETAAEQEHAILSGDAFEVIFERWVYDQEPMSSTQAADFIGVSTSHMRRLILEGKVKARKLGHDWLIDPRDLQDAGRQRKPKTKKAAA